MAQGALGRRRCKACIGWSWAAACGVQGRGHIAQLPAQLVTETWDSIDQQFEAHVEEYRDKQMYNVHYKSQQL